MVAELLELHGEFRNRHLARAMQISRQAASKHLCRMVSSGELNVRGMGAGTRYSKGPGHPTSTKGVLRGGERTHWYLLLAMVPERLAYVHAATLIGPRIIRRSQVKRAVDDLAPGTFLILDFEDTLELRDAPARELFCRQERAWGLTVQPVNMTPEVHLAYSRALRSSDIHGRRSPGA
jgi:hypothetical protein